VYKADERGSLIALSRVSTRPWEISSGHSCGNHGWTWLAASRARVWGIWASRFGGGCQHEGYTGVTYPGADAGELAPEPSSDSWVDTGWAAIDPGSDVLYKSRYDFLYYGPAPLTAHTVSAGRLVMTGQSGLCLAAKASGPVKPLVAVRGYVFGSARVGNDYTVCSWEGPGLAPRSNLGISGGHGAAFSPPSGAASALVAMAGDVFAPDLPHAYVGTQVRLLSMESDGGLALLDTVELSNQVFQLLFHPSGRFLYVADDKRPLPSHAPRPPRPF